MTARVPSHTKAHREKHHGQPLGRLGQEVRRARRTKHRCRGTAAEAATCLGASASLHQDQDDHRDSDEDINNSGENNQIHGYFLTAPPR